MDPASSATPPPPPRRPATLYAGLLTAFGFILFGAGAVAGLASDGPPAEAVVAGIAAWQIAVAGFLGTLGGALWLLGLAK